MLCLHCMPRSTSSGGGLAVMHRGLLRHDSTTELIWCVCARPRTLSRQLRFPDSRGAQKRRLGLGNYFSSRIDVHQHGSWPLAHICPS
eukprot:3277078-Pleurochrysis_carterae.AAC.4